MMSTARGGTGASSNVNVSMKDVVVCLHLLAKHARLPNVRDVNEIEHDLINDDGIVNLTSIISRLTQAQPKSHLTNSSDVS